MPGVRVRRRAEFPDPLAGGVELRIEAESALVLSEEPAGDAVNDFLRGGIAAGLVVGQVEQGDRLAVEQVSAEPAAGLGIARAGPGDGRCDDLLPDVERHLVGDPNEEIAFDDAARPAGPPGVAVGDQDCS